MSKVVKAAGILALFALIAKLIGALYRIPLTNIIGVEGIGLYQMVFPIYSVLLTIASGGLPIAISSLVASKNAKGDIRATRRILFSSLAALSVVGVVAFFLLMIFRDKIAVLQGNPLASLAYLGIAPSLIFVAVIACFRGYFNGLQNTFPSGISQLAEQAIKLAVGLTLAKILFPYGLEYAVLGATLGVSASELIAALGLSAYFLIHNRKYLKSTRVSLNSLEVATEFTPFVGKKELYSFRVSDTLKELYKVALPVTLGQLVMPITQVIDSVLIVNILVSLGESTASATSLFGLLNGPISTLINMPIVVTMSIAVAFLPVVSDAFSKNKEMGKMVGTGLKLTFFVAVLGFIVFAVFPRDILSLLYRRSFSQELLGVGTGLLFLGSLTVIYVSILQSLSATLQAIGKAHIPAINLVIGAIIKVLLTLLLLPIFGIFGAMLATILCYSTACILDAVAVRKYALPIVKISEFLVSPLIAAGGFVAVGIIVRWIAAKFLAPRNAFIVALVIAALTFVALVVVFKGLNKEELGTILNRKKATKKQKENEKDGEK